MSEQRPVILILEDEDQVRVIVRDVLQSQGYTVIETANEIDAVAICERPDQRLDLLISDVVLRGAGGPAIACRIQTLRPQMPILFVSGYPIEELANRGLLESSGSDTKISFLSKPFYPDQLLSRIRALISAE